MDGSWWTILTKCGPLEKEIANHFSILTLRSPWTIWKKKKILEWVAILFSRGSSPPLQEKEMATSTPVLLPRKFHGWRSLVGYSPWSHKKSDTIERLHFHFPRDLPHPGIKLKSLHCWKILYHLSHQGSLALNIVTRKYKKINCCWNTEFYNSKCCPVAYSCLILCDALDCSKLDPSVSQYLLKFSQVHVHCISDAI